MNDQRGNTSIASSSLSAASSVARMTYTCRVCSKSFSSATHHSRHESYHFCYSASPNRHRMKGFRVCIADRKFHCYKCDAAFFAVASRTRHQKQHLFSKYGSSAVDRSWTKLRQKGCIERDTYPTCQLCGKVFRYRPCLRVHLQHHGFTTVEWKNEAKQGVVCRKAETEKVVEAEPRYIDGVLENRTVDLCLQQDAVEKCDEFLSSLDGSALDHLTEAASVVQLGPLSYICTACGKEFASKNGATYHVRLHCGQKPHVCATCGKTFVDMRNMKKHERRHVPLSKRPRCAHCGAQFLTERCLLRHGDGSFQNRRCTLCGAQHRVCPTANNLLLHSPDSPDLMVTAADKLTPERSTKLEQSPEISRSSHRDDSSATSQRVGSPVTASGFQLSVQYSSSSDLCKRPMSTRNGVRIHECPECGKLLQSRSNLVRHFRQHTGERPYTCVDCGRTFADQGNMKKHSRVHFAGNRTPVLTDSIDLAAFPLDSSSEPTEVLETGSGSDLVASELVPMIKTEMMSDRSDVAVRKPTQRSKNRKASPDTFICFVCNKTFPYKSNLEGHIRTHMDQRPYQCEVCGKAFKRAGDLLIHSRYHDEQKQFECLDCGRRFRWKNGLDRHHRVHTGERPFLCNQCGRAFADWGSHKQHMRRHAGLSSSFLAERYSCKLCGKSFAWKRGLFRHTQQVHSWDVPSTAVTG